MAVKFLIFKDGNQLQGYTPVAPVVLGPESVPIAGEVVFRDGVLIANRSDEHAIGLGLLWDMGPLGCFHLETTRLQHRDAPYILNLELARGRLMKIIQKREDWNLFDFPRMEKLQALFQEAQSLFVEALSRQDEPAEASTYADQALELALDMSEQLAVFHGELLLNRRRLNGPYVKHMFGCRIDPTIQNEKYRETVLNSFDYAVLPIPWRVVQPTEQEFVTQQIDEWVELLTRRRMPIIAGPLLQLREQDVPDWMYIWENEFETMRDLCLEYIHKIVYRYRKAVSVWNVVAGVGSNTLFPMSFEQSIEFTRLMVAQVKNVMPGARTLVTISQPFGEQRSRLSNGAPPLLYAEMVAQSGISFEGFGLELEVGIPVPGMYTRDLFQYSSLLDRFSSFGKPLFLTAVGVPACPGVDPSDRSEGQNDPSNAGRWRRPWDPQLQADWIDSVYRIAFSKPFVESVSWANVADMHHTLPGGGLIDDMLQPKLGFTKLQELRERFHAWSRK
jgi:hypothetical protein